MRLKPLIHLSEARHHNAVFLPKSFPSDGFGFAHAIRVLAAHGALLPFIKAMAVPISPLTSLMLPGTIIVLFFWANWA